MKLLNYNYVLQRTSQPGTQPPHDLKRAVVHKDRGPASPRVSFILLDWECRERFKTLDWLLRQDVPKAEYELIWVELYRRTVPEVLDNADVVITCNQRGMYHKHKGYNIGLLHARGEVIVVCDSDAVFPRDFVSSIYRMFKMENGAAPIPLVLMHHEWRTGLLYPYDLTDAEDLQDREKWGWWPLNPNAGACMTVRRSDAMRFGGFDEHESLRGYFCGPYELGWRLVNAGIPEVWHDESCALWHFAHPDPIGVNGIRPTFAALRENRFPHVDCHAMMAVEAFSTGRMLPLTENPVIWRQRMAWRCIGTDFERKYGVMTTPAGFSRWLVFWMRADLFMSNIANPFVTALRNGGRAIGKKLPAPLARLANAMGRLWTAVFPADDPENPEFKESRAGYNIVYFNGRYYGVPQELGPIDFYDREQLANPKLLIGWRLGAVKRSIGKAMQRPPLTAPMSSRMLSG